MPEAPRTHKPFSKAAQQRTDREFERKRGSARERGYSSAWDKAAKGHLRNCPLCRYCELHDRVTAAVLVDHLYPHEGDMVLFWRREWWVSSCDDCHNGFKQRLERQGKYALDGLARDLGLPVRRVGGA